MVGYNWVVSGMVVGVLDSVMDSVLDPNSLWPPAEVENLNNCEFARRGVLAYRPRGCPHAMPAENGTAEILTFTIHSAKRRTHARLRCPDN